MTFTKKALSSLSICAAMLLTTVQSFPIVPMSVAAADYSAASGESLRSALDSEAASWFGEATAIGLANQIIGYQITDEAYGAGGWQKTPGSGGDWAYATIDNETTTSQIRFLARVYAQTGTKKYLNSCLEGIECLIEGQYDNGGWPQIFNLPSDSTNYHTRITYNDNAIVNTLTLLTEVRDQTGDFTFVNNTYADMAETAVDKGLACILDTQIIVDGKYTAWCQQHDSETLEPAWGRAFEPPAICTSESVNIIKYLLTIENPDAALQRRINAAIDWITSDEIVQHMVMYTEYEEGYVDGVLTVYENVVLQ